mmetsp:Transcript_51072/g.127176  ORF Transcript_51072/g.127176 Transcript_51072/m.127176 type:complete len:219 (+) Transcript_51072:175-831(+)
MSSASPNKDPTNRSSLQVQKQSIPSAKKATLWPATTAFHLRASGAAAACLSPLSLSRCCCCSLSSLFLRSVVLPDTPAPPSSAASHASGFGSSPTNRSTSCTAVRQTGHSEGDWRRTRRAQLTHMPECWQGRSTTSMGSEPKQTRHSFSPLSSRLASLPIDLGTADLMMVTSLRMLSETSLRTSTQSWMLPRCSSKTLRTTPSSRFENDSFRNAIACR